MSSSVLIIVLCYNGIELTLACLESLRRLDYARADVLVVDNASSDGTPARVRERFPEITVIETGRNLGYAEGNNVGLRHALDHGYDYALLLNNDTEVAADFVTELVRVCEADRTVGVAGPKMYYFEPKGYLYSIGGEVDWRRGTTRMIGLDQLDDGQFDGLREVDFVNGCALMARLEAVRQAGLLDPRFFMYYEETEWCVRIRRAGWRIVYVPRSVIWHKIEPARQAESARIAYYMTRNRLLFLKLTRAPIAAWLHAALLQDGRTWLSYAVKPKWRHKSAQRRAMGQAWADFLRGRFGMA
ncbi:MAG: glycosyltransferase family 2 protein [Anaerolineae bacterium]|nr:glycosyltransferase family 2 protein [Anaerolineae bacterium]